ncbi:MAG: DndE family protein [Candidatus Hodarchaeales archaeon]
MNFNRISISREADEIMELLVKRTGLRPNIISRFAIIHSINEPGKTNPNKYDSGGREFNRFTLTGEWDVLFITFLKERCIEDGLNPEKDLIDQFKAHLNRGILALGKRVKDLGDFINMI